MPIRVECYAGYKGEETPRRFHLGDTVFEVDEVIDQWLEVDHRYFKVRARDNVYILRHDVARNAWEITMYDRTGTLSS